MAARFGGFGGRPGSCLIDVRYKLFRQSFYPNSAMFFFGQQKHPKMHWQWRSMVYFWVSYILPYPSELSVVPLGAQGDFILV